MALATANLAPCASAWKQFCFGPARRALAREALPWKGQALPQRRFASPGIGVMAGTVRSPDKQTLLHHILVLERAGASQGWGPRLEMQPLHPVGGLRAAAGRHAMVTAVEPANEAAATLTERLLEGGALACLVLPTARALRAGSVSELADQVRGVVESPSDSPPAAEGSPISGHDLVVCIHAARDKRCGSRGPVLLERLRSAARGDAELSGLSALRLWGSSHVGGHLFAPTALCSAGGHWFGSLESGAGDEAAQAACSTSSTLERELLRFATSDAGCSLCGPPGGLLGKRWRGRMGLSRKEQIAAAKEAASLD